MGVFEKYFLGYHLSGQTVWIQIRTDTFLGLTWVQTVCNGYQQSTLVGKMLSKICLISVVCLVSNFNQLTPEVYFYQFQGVPKGKKIPDIYFWNQSLVLLFKQNPVFHIVSVLALLTDGIFHPFSYNKVRIVHCQL